MTMGVVLIFIRIPLGLRPEAKANKNTKRTGKSMRRNIRKTKRQKFISIFTSHAFAIA
jgi:hypothetical protein